MKKIITSMIVLLFFTLFVVVISNKKIVNQIIVSVEDIYDKVSNDEETISNIEDVKINELQPKNATFYYNTLTDEQKKIYKSIAIAIKNLDTTAKIKDYNYIDDNTTMQDVKIVIQNLFLDHPEIFYVKNDYTVSTIELIDSKRIEVELGYTVSGKDELETKILKINEVISPIISTADTMDNFNAEVYIHDKICEIATYYKYVDINEVPEECHSIYGCFVSKSAVCDGLSKALQIVLDKVGIESILVTGNLQNQAHAWNLVKLDDSWYHVDITSNKSIKNENDNKEEIIHSYFNITTDQIKNSSTIDLEDKIPVANSTIYNYYIQTGKYIDVTDNFTTKLKSILNENKNDNLAEFAVNLNVRSVPEKMVYVLQDSKYNKYVNTNANKFNYYNILNSYILISND